MKMMTLKEQELSNSISITEQSVMEKAEECLESLRELRKRVPKEWNELMRCDTGSSMSKTWELLKMLSKHNWFRAMNEESLDDDDFDNYDDDIDF